MDENWIIILLTSTVVSTLVSVGANYFIEKRKYNQEYWKITISKRLEVYESIEKILIYFQSSHIVEDRPCHLAFITAESLTNLNLEIAKISWKRNWVSAELYVQLIALNRLIYCAKEKSDTEKYGVEKYKEIQAIRDRMLIILQEDYLNMPKVKRFYKSKLKEAKNTEKLEKEKNGKNQIH